MGLPNVNQSQHHKNKSLQQNNQDVEDRPSRTSNHIACIGYGGLLEIMQAKAFSERSGDWLDFIANSFGCLMGLWFFSKQKFRLSQTV